MNTQHILTPALALRDTHFESVARAQEFIKSLDADMCADCAMFEEISRVIIGGDINLVPLLVNCYEQEDKAKSIAASQREGVRSNGKSTMPKAVAEALLSDRKNAEFWQEFVEKFGKNQDL